MTQSTENLTVWELYFKAVTNYRGEHFQVPTRFTTVTCQIGEESGSYSPPEISTHLWRAVISHTVKSQCRKSLII